MSSRFTTNLGLLLLAAWLAVATFALGRPTVTWIALGVGVAAVLLALGGFATSTRGAGQRLCDVVAAVGAGWLIVASRTMSSGVVRWTSVGEAGVLAALATLGLALNERRHAQARRGGAEPALQELDGPARDATFNPHPVLAGRSGSRA